MKQGAKTLIQKACNRGNYHLECYCTTPHKGKDRTIVRGANKRVRKYLNKLMNEEL